VLRALEYLYLTGVAIATAISSWIVGVKMRRRMKRSLGRDVSDGELTSISSWMRVEDEEERNRGGRLS